MLVANAGVRSKRAHILFFSILSVIALGGMWALKIGTPDGLGLTNDSAAYIAGARSILQGTGYSDIWLDHAPEPITHWPPLFSFSLAVLGYLTGLDPMRGARLLIILLYGGNIFLMGFIGRKVSRSHIGGVILAFLFATQATFLRVHSFALSEPLYLFFTLAAFVTFALHFERGQTRYLAATGVLTGLACLTRYTGLTLLAALTLATLVLHVSWRERLRNAAVLLGSGLPWPLAWMMRDLLLTGSATNRGVGWHPLTAENIRLGLNRFARFLVPVETWWLALKRTPGVFPLLAFLAGLSALTWVLFTAGRRFFRPTSPRPDALVLSNGIYFIVYFASLLTSMTFFDPATHFQDRILLPMLVALLILAFAGGWSLWQRKGAAARTATLLLLLLVGAMGIVGYGETLAELQKGGQVYAGWKWRQSPAMEVIRQTPPEVAIYTNSPPAVYLVTGRASRYVRLPMGEGPDVERSLQTLRADVQAGRALLVLFNTKKESTQADLQRLTAGLPLAYKFGDDLIFGQP